MRNSRNSSRGRSRRRKKSKLPIILGAMLVLALVTVTAVWAIDMMKGKKGTASRQPEKGNLEEEAKKDERPDKIDVEIKKIELKADKRTVRVGDAVELSAKISPDDATYKKIIWTSSNDNYVEITKDGKMIPKEAGANHKVKITASSDDGSGVKIAKTFRILPKINPEEPMVAITYDDGPHPTVTEEILDALEENNAVATFFMLGDNISGREEILKRSKNLGNELCSHSYDHPQLTKSSEKKIRSQMARTDKLIKEAIGKKAPLMRPPYGAYNQKVRENVEKPMILWTVDTLDWQHKDSEKTYESCMEAKDGDIILMHDIQPSSGEAAADIYRGLQEKGFQLVTVSEMYEARGQELKDGGSYFSMPWSEVAASTATSSEEITSEEETASDEEMTSEEETTSEEEEDLDEEMTSKEETSTKKTSSKKETSAKKTSSKKETSAKTT